jgi:outer membrane protein assembly factor BamB
VLGTVVLLLAIPALGAPGDLSWEAQYDGGGSDIAYDLAVAPDGSAVYTVGRSKRETHDFATAAFDAMSGAELWSQRFDGGKRDYAVAAVAGPNGAALYVTGPSFHETLDFETIAYDTETGEVIWVSEYDDPGHRPDVPTSTAIAPDGSQIYVSGLSGGRKHRDWRTVALSAEDGSLLWSRRYGTQTHFEVASDVLAAPDGSAIFVTGSNQSVGPDGHGRWDSTTIAYEAETGDVLWRISVKDLGGGSVALSPDATTVYVVGPILDERQHFVDYFTIALSASSGETRWTRRYATPRWDEPTGLAVGPDGKVYVTGFVATANTVLTTTFAYSASGQELWKAEAPLPYGDVEIAVSPDGATVYLSLRPSNEEIMTLAYDAALGRQSWSHVVIRDSIGAGRDLSLGLAPDGSKLFVAGSGFSPEGDFDFTTVAYAD